MKQKSAIGFSSLVITPKEESVPLGGYRTRLSTGVHDDIYVHTSYFCDGQEEILIISTDLISLYGTHVNRMRRAIRKQTGIVSENILICALHNHSSPDTLGLFGLKGFFSNTLKTSWFEKIQQKIVQSAIQAKQNARSGKIGIKQGLIPDRLTINRRRPLRPNDYKLSVLRINNDQGEMKGVIVNYACHETTLNRKNTLITAEFPGYMIRKIQKNLPNTFVEFLNGPCGDINPNLFPQDRPYEEIDYDYYLFGTYFRFNELANYGHTKRIGEKLADNVIKFSEEIQCEEIHQIQVLKEKLIIPISFAYPNISMTNRLITLLLKTLIPRFLLFYRRTNLAYSNFRIKKRKPRLETEIQFIKINKDILIIAVPVELFNALGVEIIEKSPFKHTMIVTLANDYIGYVYPEEERDMGGYEVFGEANMSGIYAGPLLRRKIFEMYEKIK